MQDENEAVREQIENCDTVENLGNYYTNRDKCIK